MHLDTLRLMKCSAGILLFLLVPNLGRAQSTAETDASHPVDVTALRSKPLPENLFKILDKNDDGVVIDAELTEQEREEFAQQLWRIYDQNKDRRILRDEFEQALPGSRYGDSKTYTAILLVFAFSTFCMFVDGLFDPARRDFFWLLIMACTVLLGIAFFFDGGWFLEVPPYLVWVGAAPVFFMVLAIATGNTREIEHELVATSRQKVYVVGGGGSTANAESGTPTASRPAARRPQRSRGSLAPGRVVRRVPPRSSGPQRRPPSPPRGRPPQPPGPRPGGSRPPGGDRS